MQLQLAVLLLTLLLHQTEAQHRFRSILIERACQRRKSLDFCNENEEPKVEPIPELIIPPAINQSQTTTSTSTKAATTTTSPGEEVEFGRADSDKEVAGSLVKLPKPSANQTESQSTATNEHETNETKAIEDEKGVLVFVSEYCVLEREHFVRKCHGNVEKDEVDFCKAYPAACTSTSGVLPVLSYCQRYYKHYPRYCTKDPIPKTVIQFCYAFESFCLPELVPAKPTSTAQPALRRCEDVLPEARKGRIIFSGTNKLGLLTLEQQMGNKIEKPKGIVRREKPEHMPNRIAFRNINEIDATKLPTVLPKRQCFLRVLRLDRTKDYLQMEQEFIARQMTRKGTTARKREEKRVVENLRGKAMTLARIMELFEDEKHAVVTVEGLKMEWYIPILSIVDKDLLCVNALVLVRIDRSRVLPAAVVGVLDDTKMNTVALSYKVEKAPKNTFEDIGGCEAQIQELKESVELPLTHPEYYEEMGISAPKGVILYGEPGTGKTLLAKAIANSTKARFIRATGADFVKKEPGEGAKLVRSLFKLARESAPCIVFLDEIDAVGTKRFDSTSRGKTKMIDEAGISRMFQASVKSRGQCLSCSTSWMVSMLEEMSRIDSLDPALIRSGRIDRKIEFTKPDDKAKQKIYSIHTSAMSIAKDVTYENTFGKQKTLNGAEIKAGCLEKNGLNEKKKILQAICSEAGMLALRQQRKIVMKEDFVKAIEKVLLKTKGEGPEELYQ